MLKPESSQSKAEKFTEILSARKLVATVLWDRKGVLIMEFMRQGATITSEVYYETLRKLRRASHSELKAWNADIQCTRSVPP
jgi:hypothetical protein